MEQPEKKKNQDRAYDSELGDELLTEFLRRLPLKSLFKFKCVSKHWLSLISDPFMLRLYLPRTHVPTCTLLCRHVCPGLHNVSIKIESHPGFESVNFNLGFVPKEPEELRIVAADKGLLLSCELSATRQAYYVSDPWTGQWTGLPEPPRISISKLDIYESELRVVGSGSYYQPRGVGSTPGTGSIDQPRAVGFIVGPGLTCRVIRIQDFDHDCLQLASFNWIEGRWRSSIVHLSHPVKKVYDRLVPGVLYRGALHWAVQNPDSDRGRIVAYDPVMHESEGDDYICRVFDCAPPSGLCGEGGLGLSDGEIRYAELTSPYYQINRRFSDSRFLCVWLLKDYDSAEWCLEHKVLESKIMAGFPIIYDRLYLWDFNPVDRDIVYFCVTSGMQRSPSYCKSVASYSISGRTMKLLCTHGIVDLPPTPVRANTRRDNVLYSPRRDNFTLFPMIFAVPFVLPPWPNEVNKQSVSETSNTSSCPNLDLSL